MHGLLTQLSHIQRNMYGTDTQGQQDEGYGMMQQH